MPVRHVTTGQTDSHDGVQTTFIEANFDDGEIRMPPDQVVVSAAKVRCQVACNSDIQNNVTVQGFQRLSPGTLTIWRYQIDNLSSEGQIGVGFTYPGAFGSGYRCKSITLRQQGNLCSHGCFKSSWGERFGQGDVIDLYIESHQGGTLVVYPALNNKPFGKHFTVEFGDKIGTIQELIPLACFGAGNYSMIISDVKQVPIPAAAPYKQVLSERTTPEGTWHFRQEFNPALGIPWRDFAISIHNGKLGARVGNTMMFDVHLEAGGRIRNGGGPATTTRMAVMGPLRDAEVSASTWGTSVSGTWALEQNGLVLRIGDHRFDIAVADATISAHDNVLVTP